VTITGTVVGDEIQIRSDWAALTTGEEVRSQ